MKISFCTVCMNRLHHLKQTLFKNLSDNRDCKELEFVVLDYNSNDGLEDYIKENLTAYIESKRLVYYKTNTPVYFRRSHSRNLCFKLASGEILVNIDADNFTGQGFASYIQSRFTGNKEIFLSALGSDYKLKKADIFGRICVRRADFIRVGGYDERMENYGFEDFDLINRLEMTGLKRQQLKKPSFLKAIEHGHDDRLSNEYLSSNLEYLMLSYLTSASTRMLLLFKDGTLRCATIINNYSLLTKDDISEKKQSHLKYQFSISERNWNTGTWIHDGVNISLKSNKGSMNLCFNETDNYYSMSVKNTVYRYYHINDIKFIREAIMFYSQVSNRLIMEKNRTGNILNVNKNIFGKDSVYQNFDCVNSIKIL